jgi:hypothetical protein
MIRRLIEQYREKRKFTAEKCRSHQEEELEKRASTIIEDIRAYINFKVDNTNEKTVIVHNPEDPKVSKFVEDFYTSRGFIVFRKKFEELDETEYLVVSWNLK